MSRPDLRILWGILLIAGGTLLLVENLGAITIGAYGWPLLFGAVGLGFLYVFLAERTNWWASIPGFVLLSLGTLIAVNEFAPQVGEDWGGSIVLGGIGLSFWAIYLTDRVRWWSVIPGGVLFTIALVAGLSSIFEGAAIGGVFFVGLGLTFALLSLAPTPAGSTRWARIPAVALTLMGLLIMAAFGPALGYLWPAALILGGLYLLLRAIGSP